MDEADRLEAISIEVSPNFVEALVSEVTKRSLGRIGARPSAEAWPEWLSVITAARYLDVSPERLRKLQARKEVPFHQEAPGCRVLFRRADLDEWMSGFRQPPRRRPASLEGLR